MNRAVPDTLVAPPPAPPLPTRARVLLGAAFAAGYLVLDWVSYIHPLQQSGITPWNPQPALAIALLMLGGRGWLPMVFAAAVAAEWLVRGNLPWSAATLLVATVLCMGYAGMAWALSGRFAVDAGLGSLRDAVRLVCVVAAGALLTGALYVAALLATGAVPLAEPATALVRYWIGDAVGILVTLPLVLMMSVPGRRREMAELLRRPESLGHGLGVAVALGAVFAGPASDRAKYFYVLFLPLIFAATRLGLVGAALCTLLIQGAIIVAGESAGYQDLTVLQFQSLLIALAVTGLFLGVTVDERRRAEEELRRSLRFAAAGEMAAALAHELNQPLTALSTYARASQAMLRSGEPAPGTLEQTLDKLLAESTRAADVVRRLRDFFRTGATGLAPLSLGALAARMAEAQRGEAGRRGVCIEVQAPAPGAEILGDATQLGVVLRNLYANAIEAAAGGAEPRRVRIVVETATSAARLEVHDSGPGVRPADAARIFEPFETTRATGMGMGLAISRAIVEAHGGHLSAEPGRHGLFRMTLPLREPDHG